MNDRWNQIGEKLFEKAGELARSGRGPQFRDQWKTLPGLLELLFDRERAARRRGALLARQLARAGSAPETEGWDEYFLWCRLENACDFLAQILVADSRGRQMIPQPDSDNTDAELIDWLLISIWERRCDHCLKMLAQSLALDRPFYGLEDAPPVPGHRHV